MSRRGRLGRRGAAGRRRTGPAEIKASSDGRGALTHRMMADLESSFDGRGALTHRMVAAVQGYVQWTSREPADGVMNRLRCGWSSDSDGRSLHRDKMPCRVTRLLRMEWEEGRWPGAAGPGRRRRLAADRAEPAHDPRCTVGGWSRLSANRQRSRSYSATIRLCLRIESRRGRIDFRSKLR